MVNKTERSPFNVFFSFKGNAFKIVLNVIILNNLLSYCWLGAFFHFCQLVSVKGLRFDRHFSRLDVRCHMLFLPILHRKLHIVVTLNYDQTYDIVCIPLFSHGLKSHENSNCLVHPQNICRYAGYTIVMPKRNALAMFSYFWAAQAPGTMQANSILPFITFIPAWRMSTVFTNLALLRWLEI